MTYMITFKDEHGDWFFARPGRWSDSARDAFRFTDKTIAETEADAAASRLNARPEGTYSRARCRVVSMRAGS